MTGEEAYWAGLGPEDFRDEEPECECVYIDADFVDSSECLLHGPRSAWAKKQRELEAEAEAIAAKQIPYLLGEDPETWKE